MKNIFLYSALLFVTLFNSSCEKVVDIELANQKNLEIYSRQVLKMIAKGIPGWEEMLPKGVSEIIKRDNLFGYDPKVIYQEKAN